VGADVTAVGSSFARGDENNQHQPDGSFYLGSGRNPGYAVLNLSAEYRPVSALKIFVQVNNALNTKYSTAAQLGSTVFDAKGNVATQPFPTDANGDSPAQNSTFLSPGAPRTFWVGVRYSFGN
jgi:outer membrane receptor protein involved in Fe transport